MQVAEPFELKDFYVLYLIFITMMNRFVLSILLLAVVGLSLHYQTHDMQAHAVTDEEYYKGLMDLQNKLIESMIKVKTHVNGMSAQVKVAGTVATTDTTTLQTLLKEEKDALDKVENYIKVPLTPKPCNTSAQTIKTRDALQKESQQLNGAVQSLKKELAACTKCTISTDLNQAILQQQNYVSVINEICKSSCTNVPKPVQPQAPTGLVDLSQNQYKNNLQAKNWVYGNITEDQYKYQVFADSIKYNQTSCPLAKPYVNPLTNNCFQCPDGLNFNLGKKTCETCPNNFTYNLTTNICDSPCNSTEVYNTSTQKCQPKPLHPTDSICPPQKPVWNSISKSCQVCPVATPIYDKTKQQCVACPANTTWEATSQQCVPSCAQDEVFDPATQKCIKKPICAEGTTLNKDTQKCQPICPNGTKYNNVTKQCEKIEPQNCTDLKPVWNSTSLACEICPEKTPVWNKQLKKCDPCPPETPVYDYALLKCVDKICDPGFKWNRMKLKCSPLTGNCTKEQEYIFENETCVTKCQANHTYYKENDTCECFSQKPVFNKTTRTCEAPPCPAGQKWNQNLLKCIPQTMKCETASQFYNFTAGKCVDKCEPGVQYIATNDSCKCPPQMPVFNATTRKCEEGKCNAGYAWNKKLLRCSLLTKNCSEWQTFEFDTEKCIDKCEVNHTYIKENDTCQCTAEYPRFDPQTRTCQKPICPQGYVWNKQLVKCSEVNKTCQSWELYDFKTENCVVKCEVNMTYFEKYDNCTCPPERPVYNQTLKKCIEPSCPQGTKFNPSLVSCLSITGDCKSWQSYDFNTGQCIQKCEENQTYFKENDTCTCPGDRPFFNTTTKNCTIPPCANGTKWNEKLRSCTELDKKCQIWQMWSFTDGKCIDMCPVNRTYFKETDTCACDPEKPEFDKKTRKCIEPVCPQGYLWNKLLIKCSEAKKNCSAWQTYNFTSEDCHDMCEVNVTYDRRTDTCLCPPQKPHFDNTTRKCLVPNCTEGFKYNPNMVKCSSILGNCSAWEVYNFTDESCTAKCQVNHTYFKEDDSCSCTPEKPLFDTKTRKCVDAVCPIGYKYNINLLKCSVLTKTCEKWQAYNFTTEECMDKCEVNHTYFPGDDTCSCLPEAPHFDPKTRKCVIPPCENGTMWNKNLNKCSPLTKNCSSWQLYNFTTQQCDVKCHVSQQYHPSTQTCQCTPEFPLFDSKTQQCLEPTCPSGYKWNKNLFKCSPLSQPCQKWQFYDFASERCVARCQTNHTYYKENDTCQCFPQKPIFNKITRVCEVPSCPNSTRWNPHLNKCSSISGTCERWQIYNFTDETCITKCDKYQTYYPNNDTCSCYPADPIYNRTTRKCEEPVCLYGQFWDRVNYKCRCKDGLEFNITSKTCQIKCNTGEFLNFTTNRCQLIPPTCGANMFVNASNQCQCLPGYVYNEGGLSCRVNCTEGYRYNQVTKQCEVITCPSGFTFNALTQKCQQSQMCPAGFFYNSATNKCISCPAGFVYNSVRNLCQAQTNNVCPAGYTFNPSTKLCDPNFRYCPTGFYFDDSAQKCLALYITSPQAANLITTNMTNYTEYYTLQKKSNSRLQDCGNPTPFYDQNSHVCVSCPADHPYFNLDLNKCESCGTLTYNSSTYSCVNVTVKKNYQVDPTIGRFISNVI